MKCSICHEANKLFENNHAYAVFASLQREQGHIRIVPKRHVADYFSLTIREKFAIDQLLDVCHKYLLNEFEAEGFHIEIHCESNLEHTYVNLIPQYSATI